MAIIKEVALLDQDHFCERMGVCFILNAPGAFGLVWRIVRPWLAHETIRRIPCTPATTGGKWCRRSAAGDFA